MNLGMEFTTVLLIVLPLVAVQLVLMISALVSIVRKPVQGSDKLLWVIIVVLVNLIGPIIYFVVGSNMLDEKAAKEEREDDAR